MFKDHPREENNLDVILGWSLIAGSTMQKMIEWEIKSVVVIDRKIAIQRWSLAQVFL